MMRITFLGTAAAEALPFPYCECTTCCHARQHKGKNVRKRSSYIINDDLLVDMGPDLFPSCADRGISLTQLKYALVSHSHADHFYVPNLSYRAKGFHQYNDLDPLILVAPPSALALLGQSGALDMDLALKRKPFLPFEQLDLPPYRIESVQASHQSEVGDALNYIIEAGRQRILIASDTGMYAEPAWEALHDRQFELVVMECTMGTTARKASTHLNMATMRAMIEKLTQIGAVSAKTRIYGTHFSHHSVPPHDELQQRLQELGVRTAYDGLCVTV